MRASEPGLAIYALFSAVALAVRLFYRWKSGGTRVAKRSGSWSDGALAWSAFAAMFVIPVLNFSTPLLRFANFEPPAVTIWAGAALLAFVVWLFARAHADLGLNWSIDVRIREGHALVTSGVYSRIRHPMYGALFLAGVALVPVLHNWIVSLAMLAVATLFLTVRAPHEERFLASHFGAGYRAYVARTGRVAPRLRSRRVNDGWPYLPGKYFVVDAAAPVAVTTLGSVALAQTVANAAPRGLCIVGKVETENIGIEKIVKNVLANPAIQFLVCAGAEPPVHRSGATLLALCANGVDSTGRVIGSPGRRPTLRNTTLDEVQAFRSQ
ncbi:MAG TPA: protein-S-isoprenylcysteine O-methyltransferase, partial [Candidatus Dormibacteraeota bacterium]|nr:protein-S-isoprenylcysteine O-methyltransferase [Candidatus Dormibacteraeota bacterium]